MAPSPQCGSWSKVAALLVLLALAFFAPVLRPAAVLLPTSYLKGFALFADESTETRTAEWHPLFWDAMAQYYPWRLFAHRQLRKGIIPLWNPHQFSGMPFVANGQSAVFYPPNLLFWLMDPARAFGWSAVVHAVIAALGAFALAKHLRLSDESAFVCGVAFMFNGFALAWLHLPTLMNSAAWVPWIFLAALRCLDMPSLATTAWLACAIALQALAGHLQIVQLTALGLFVFATIDAIRRRRLHGLVSIALAGAFAIALAAIQLLPTLELSMNSHRAGAQDYGGMLLRALKLWYLLLPGSPYPAHEPIHPESTGYVGFVIAALALMGMASRKTINWSVLAVVTTLVVIGAPLCYLIYVAVPGAKQMGGFFRATVLLCFALAVLAGFGCERLRERIAKGRNLIAPLIGALMFVDMFYFCWSLNPTGERAQVYPRTPIIERIQKLAGNRRVLFLCDKAWPFRPHPRGTLPPNGAMVYELSDVQGYDTLQTAAYKALMQSVERGGQPAATTNGNLLLLSDVDFAQLPYHGVRLVVADHPLEAREVRLRWNDDRVWIYELKRQFPPPPELVFAPASYTLGAFLTMLAMAAVAGAVTSCVLRGAKVLELAGR